jgi:hypothetical protein
MFENSHNLVTLLLSEAFSLFSNLKTFLQRWNSQLSWLSENLFSDLLTDLNWIFLSRKEEKKWKKKSASGGNSDVRIVDVGTYMEHAFVVSCTRGHLQFFKKKIPRHFLGNYFTNLYFGFTLLVADNFLFSMWKLEFFSIKASVFNAKARILYVNARVLKCES